MPILTPTAIIGRVVWLGLVCDREASLLSSAVEAVEAGFAGLAGESHGGLTRPSCSRVSAQYPVGTEIRNTRQASVVSAEELAAIAAAMGLERFAPEWLGTNLVLAGIPELTLVPPASRLVFAGGAALTVDLENRPCQLPAREIEARHPGRGRAFKTAASDRRGLVAWVERPGTILLGEGVRLHVPPLRLYPPLMGAH